jgi:hypothetical protein
MGFGPLVLRVNRKTHYIIDTLFSNLYYAVVGLAHVIINRNASYGVSNDMSGGWILDVGDVSTNVSLYCRVLKDAVARLVKGTILEYKVVSIAQ